MARSWVLKFLVDGLSVRSFLWLHALSLFSPHSSIKTIHQPFPSSSTYSSRQPISFPNNSTLTPSLTHWPPLTNTQAQPLPLRAPAPHILQHPIPLRQPIQTIVPFAHRPDEPAQRVDLVLARVAPVLVDFADGDLHRGVVLRFDDAVGRGAFAGDVAGWWEMRGVVVSRLWFWEGLGGEGGWAVGSGGWGKGGLRDGTYRSTSSPLSFSMFAVDWGGSERVVLWLRVLWSTR